MDIPQIEILSDGEMDTLHLSLQCQDIHKEDKRKETDVSNDLSEAKYDNNQVRELSLVEKQSLILRDFFILLKDSPPFQRVTYPKIREILLDEQWMSLSVISELIQKLVEIQNHFVSVMVSLTQRPDL